MKFAITMEKATAATFNITGATVLERQADPDDATIEHLLVESPSDLRWKMPLLKPPAAQRAVETLRARFRPSAS